MTIRVGAAKDFLFDKGIRIHIYDPRTMEEVEGPIEKHISCGALSVAIYGAILDLAELDNGDTQLVAKVCRGRDKAGNKCNTSFTIARELGSLMGFRVILPTNPNECTQRNQ